MLRTSFYNYFQAAYDTLLENVYWRIIKWAFEAASCFEGADRTPKTSARPADNRTSIIQLGINSAKCTTTTLFTERVVGYSNVLLRATVERVVGYSNVLLRATVERVVGYSNVLLRVTVERVVGYSNVLLRVTVERVVGYPNVVYPTNRHYIISS
jgi:hypothetical protein